MRFRSQREISSLRILPRWQTGAGELLSGMVDFHYGVLNGSVRLWRSSFSIPFLFFVAIGPAIAGVNSWTKPTSGYWEEQAYWSLGTLPDATQSVVFTNAGWKALAIGANTAQNFPPSMQIQTLQIASPADSRNTLLMNFSGFEMPLQTTSLTVGSNSSVVVQSSSLDAGNVSLTGDFSHGDYSQVRIHGPMHIGSYDGTGYNFPTNAGYYLTNGTLSVDANLSMGGFGGGGKLVQYGGFNNVGSLGVSIQGEFDIYDGQATVTNVITVGTIGDFANESTFNQYGGNVNADSVINGNYVLIGGTITGHMQVVAQNSFQRANAFVLQTGGTNHATSLDLGDPNTFAGEGFYTLSNGVVRVDTSAAFHGGPFSQYNGQVTIVSNLVMQGRDLQAGNAYAEYLLAGGTLSVGGGLTAAIDARFQQNGGTNLIAEDLVLVASGPPQTGQSPQTDQYTLTGGFLSARNVIVNAAFYGGFHQTGGSNQITEKLTVQGVSPGAFYYTLEGGTLTVKDIYLGAGAFFQHTSGNIVHSGVLTLNQGDWNAAAGAQSLGPLQLTGGSATNSAITFPNGSSTLRLANSSAQPWDSTASLYVTNWHGSASGGGATQLFFGSDASGLTSQQLALIKFSLSSGLLPARILATGEVVPQNLLTFSRSGNTLTLTWGPGWTLQSSTNVAGPYQDVQEAASPYPASMANPSQFFRLRQ
jgi:hypothetical protein